MKKMKNSRMILGETMPLKSTNLFIYFIVALRTSPKGIVSRWSMLRHSSNKVLHPISPNFFCLFTQSQKYRTDPAAGIYTITTYVSKSTRTQCIHSGKGQRSSFPPMVEGHFTLKKDKLPYFGAYSGNGKTQNTWRICFTDHS